jgi:Nuclease-related domain
MPVALLQSRVWQRHGQLRLYISGDGLDVGWCDPRTGRFELHQPALEPEFWQAVQARCDQLLREGRLREAVIHRPGPPRAARPLAELAAPADPPRAAPKPEPSPPAAAAPDERWVVRDPRWDDLASNSPGEAARARSRELWAEHPVLVTVAGLLGIRTEAVSFAVGARGERVVGRKLNSWAARYRWHVLHAVPVGRAVADIDHVVIGRFGVVTVNTKRTGSSVWVGEYGMKVGRVTVDYLRKSRAEARRTRRLLGRAAGSDVPVQPAIVFVGTRRFTIRRGGPADVAVLRSPRALRRWLRRQPQVLDDGQVDALYEVARRRSAWQLRPASAPGLDRAARRRGQP